MERKKSLIAVSVIVLALCTLVAVSLPQGAEAASLKQRLSAAKKGLRDATRRLRAAKAALAAAEADVSSVAAPVDQSSGAAEEQPADPPAGSEPAATESAVPAAPVPSIAQLRARVTATRRAVRIWRKRVRKLTRKYELQRRLAQWESRGQWRPIIAVAAARYHVKAAGIYRIMMRESGGRRRAGSGTPFRGLFQYHTGTWAASWNPYRGDSIYDGSAQIFATCYAVSRGMGPSLWTTTFWSQY